MDARVTQPPATVVDLLLRIFPPAANGGRVCRPFIASVVAMNDDGHAEEPVSTIVDSLSNTEACLLHSQPLAGKRLEVCVEVSSGELLRMMVEVTSTATRGALVETIARFLR